MDQVGGFLVVEKVRKNDVVDPACHHDGIGHHVRELTRDFGQKCRPRLADRIDLGSRHLSRALVLLHENDIVRGNVFLLSGYLVRHHSPLVDFRQYGNDFRPHVRVLPIVKSLSLTHHVLCRAGRKLIIRDNAVPCSVFLRLDLFLRFQYRKINLRDQSFIGPRRAFLVVIIEFPRSRHHQKKQNEQDEQRKVNFRVARYSGLCHIQKLFKRTVFFSCNEFIGHLIRKPREQPVCQHGSFSQSGKDDL